MEKDYWDNYAVANLDYISKTREPAHILVNNDPWLKLLTDLIDKNKTVYLDCGTGFGLLASYVNDFSKKVIAIDISHEMCKLAKQYTSKFGKNKVYVIQANLEELPIKNSSIDVALGSFVLHHTCLPKVSDELKRVLKKNGQLVFLENLALNPLIRLITKLPKTLQKIFKRGSPQEKPIGKEDLKILEDKLGNIQLFYASFVFWEPALGRIFKPLSKLGRVLDDLFFELSKLSPTIRKFSYHSIIKIDLDKKH